MISGSSEQACLLKAGDRIWKDKRSILGSGREGCIWILLTMPLISGLEDFNVSEF